MNGKKTKNIFILRNNDLGDVLVTTPLLHGLRKAFPTTKIAIGVGDWAKTLLENNPDIDRVHSVNAPWHNKQNCRYPANSLRTFLEGLLYVMGSSEVRRLRKQGFTHGIDVLGSRQGSWLHLRAGIRNRYGVKGYAGGQNWCKSYVQFKEDRKVTQAGLEFLRLLHSDINVDPRPRIYLSENESKDGRNRWGLNNTNAKRIVIAPGSGFLEKSWGNYNYTVLAKMITSKTNYKVFIIGDLNDINKIKASEINNKNRVEILCGQTTIRETAAIIKESDLAITNSSVAMHIAGAFKIPTIVCLGNAYNSAKLHQKQWGYSETTVLGKEISINNDELPQPVDVFDLVTEKLENE
jgi:ADP-heptose:LPS heptosyltransferase